MPANTTPAALIKMDADSKNSSDLLFIDFLTDAVDFFLLIIRGHRAIHMESISGHIDDLVGWHRFFKVCLRCASKVEAISITSPVRRRTGLLLGIFASLTVNINNT